MAFILAALPPACAAPPDVKLVWTDDPPTPYAPVTLVLGQSLVLNWPGAVRLTIQSPALDVPRRVPDQVSATDTNIVVMQTHTVWRVRASSPAWFRDLWERILS